MRWLLVAGTVLASVSTGGFASAQEPSGGPTEISATEAPSTGAAPAEASSGAHLHDRFYLRFGVGSGYAHDQLRSEYIIFSYEGEAQGASVVGELSAGWSLKPGLIVGGGIYFEQVADPKITVEGQDVSDDVSVGTLVLVGPMIEWYPNAKGGFHLGGAVGGARINVKDESGQTKDNSPVGGGGMFGIGYDFWVADEWSVGVAGRFTGARMEDSDANITHTWSAGSLLVNATYN